MLKVLWQKQTSHKEEKDQLQEYARNAPLVLVRLKAQSILLASNAVRTAVIADSLGRTERTVSDWLSAWRKVRMASLFTGHKDNENAAKLTKEQKQPDQRHPTISSVRAWCTERVLGYSSAQIVC